MDIMQELNNHLMEINTELKQIKGKLHSLTGINNTKKEYLTFTEISEQYPISRESLYRLKDSDVLKVSRLSGKGRFLVEREHLESIFKTNQI